ncbi:hypothetical protein CHUAL_003019 [Chamberlinius hualienensis]
MPFTKKLLLISFIFILKCAGVMAESDPLYFLPGFQTQNDNTVIPNILVTTLNAAKNWITNPENLISIIEKYLPIGVTDNCKRDLFSMIIAVARSNETWIWDMLDSFGRPSSGIRRGNNVWSGNFWQCVDVNVKNGQVAGNRLRSDSDKARFVGEYCLLGFELKNTALNTMLRESDFKDILMAICLPNTCTYVDKELLIKYQFQKLTDIKIDSRYCQTAEKEPMDYVAVILTAILFIPVILVIISTLIDCYINKTFSPFTASTTTENNVNSKKPGTAETLSKLFSARVSLMSFLYTFDNNQTEVITCLYGFRFVGMLIIIWIHIFTLQIFDFPWSNSSEFINMMDYPFVHVFSSSFTLMSSFFVITGFCLTYTTFVNTRRQRSFSIIQSYIRRYLRLTFPYFYVMVFNAGPFYYLGKGPFWPNVLHLQNMCRSHVWRRFLMAENIYKSWGYEADCVTGEWYFGTDWQLNLIAIPIVWLMIRKKRLGIALIIVAMFLSAAAIVVAKFSIPDLTLFYGTFMADLPINHTLYKQMWSRGFGFGLGMLAGYLVACHRNVNYPKALIVGGASITTVTALLLRFFGSQYIVSTGMPPLVDFLYFVFAIVLYPFSTTWVIFWCTHYPDGIVNKFFSAKIFQRLGKLGFSMLLVQLTCLYWYRSVSSKPNEMSYYKSLLEMAVITTLTVVSSMVLYFLVESPTERLLALLKSNPNPSTVKVTKQEI